MERETWSAVRDLFGDVPVSVREVEVWMYKVPRLPHYHRWRAKYPQEYNVPDKIRVAKLAGTLPEILGDQCCEYCGERLCREDEAPPADPAAEIALLKRRIMVLEYLLLPPVRARMQPDKRREAVT